MIEIKNGILSAEINEHGAELTRLTANGKDIMWNGNAEYWTGHSPVLFPICGRLAEDKFIYSGREYALKKHGFARHSDFSVKAKSDNKLMLSLCASENTRKSYPFDFELDVSFELTDKKLIQTYTVLNNGDNTMYFSLGAHPAFNVKMGGKIVFDTDELPKTLTVDSDGLINGEAHAPIYKNVLTITPHLFDNDALILKSPKSDGVTVASPEGAALVRMNFDAVPYLLIWAKPNAPYVCIEPWHGVPDNSGKCTEIEKKPAIVSLGSKKAFVFKTEIIPM